MADRYVLDAYAFLALMQDEPGADEVSRLLENPRHDLHVSAINVGETYYILHRRRGPAAAALAVEVIFQQTNLRIIEPIWTDISAAADIKANSRLSFADAFAAALARKLAAPLVTGDSEFADLERRGELQVVWLRQRAS